MQKQLFCVLIGQNYKMHHQTSIIDPKAKIDEGVDIGPYCVIESGVSIDEGNELIRQGYIPSVGHSNSEFGIIDFALENNTNVNSYNDISDNSEDSLDDINSDDYLSKLGIDIVQNLDGVGENLHDHPSISLKFEGTDLLSNLMNTFVTVKGKRLKQLRV